MQTFKSQSEEVLHLTQLIIATSLTPKNVENQLRAVESWRHLGFQVVSVNAPDEISMIRAQFPDIEFVPAKRDGREKFGKPYIYFDDLLAYFKQSDSKICGIVNSDIHLLKEHLKSFVFHEAVNSLVYGSRVDVLTLDNLNGFFYHEGFDYFFFDREILPHYPSEEFCLGLPWWDYWALLIPLLNGVAVKKLTTPVAYHIDHPKNWNPHTWMYYGTRMSEFLNRSLGLTEEDLHIMNNKLPQ